MVKSKEKEKIAELEIKIEELTNKWKRALADYSNLEKRIKEQKEGGLHFAESVLILKLLPIFDNLTKAASNLNDQGLEMVLRQLEEALSLVGVKQYGEVGEQFDPSCYEAVAVAENADDGQVVEVFSKGYKINDQVLKAAKVKVGKKSEVK